MEKSHEHESLRLGLFIFFNVVWMPLLVTTAIYKIAEDGLHDYIKHFTNWNWTASAIFMICDTVSRLFYLDTVSTNIWALYTTGFLFWIANGMSWIVSALVFFLLGDNPGILVELADDYGLGLVLGMDRFFHVIPSVFLSLYIILRYEEVAEALRILCPRSKDNSYTTWVYILAVVLCGGTLSCLLYYSCYNIEHVYGIHTPLYVLAFMTIVVNIVFNGLVFLKLRSLHV